MTDWLFCGFAWPALAGQDLPFANDRYGALKTDEIHNFRHCQHQYVGVHRLDEVRSEASLFAACGVVDQATARAFAFAVAFRMSMKRRAAGARYASFR